MDSNFRLARSPKVDVTGQYHPLLISDHNDGKSTYSDGSSRPGFWSHWKAPIIIVLLLLVGLALALGHHFLNSHLDGMPVSSISVSQSWIFRFGTAFAFLVNMAFAISVSGSYVQYQWLKLRRHSFAVEEIDSLTDIIGNALRLFYSMVFFRQPMLLLMALIAWTIPFAAVVTPGSLTVTPARNISTTKSHVPQPLFNNTALGKASVDSGALFTNAQVYRLAYNTASAGQPVALTSKFQNETYSISFPGPAVRCASADESLIRNMTLTYGSGANEGSAELTEYLSWVPGIEPYWTSLDGLSTPPNFGTTLDYGSIDGRTRIFVMSQPGYTTWDNTIYAGKYYNTSIYAQVVNVTECILWNATYNVDYHFQYPNQTSQVSIATWLNTMSPSLSVYYYGTGPISSWNATAYSTISYLSVMQAFGKLLLGYSTANQYGNYSSYTSSQIMDIDWSRMVTVQRGLESLFQNLTLSLLSHEEFTTSPSDTDPVPITVTTYPITYTYAKYQLLAAYGLAFIFAVLCAVIGLYAFFANGASYQNLFSSFVRATSGHEVHQVLDTDSNGADPLPKHQAKARIAIGAIRRRSGIWPSQSRELR